MGLVLIPCKMAINPSKTSIYVQYIMPKSIRSNVIVENYYLPGLCSGNRCLKSVQIAKMGPGKEVKENPKTDNIANKIETIASDGLRGCGREFFLWYVRLCLCTYAVFQDCGNGIHEQLKWPEFLFKFAL